VVVVVVVGVIDAMSPKASARWSMV
jgi:hypothetical protein